MLLKWVTLLGDTEDGSLTGGVDINGVPIQANGGQVIGASQDDTRNLCPVEIIEADTLVICTGDTVLIEVIHMEAPIWTGDPFIKVNDSTIKAFPTETSVYKVEHYTSRKDLFENGGFEDINTTGQIDAALVPGWNTTANDNKIEIWRNGFQGHPSYSGELFAELNATQKSALYQDVQTTPGETIKWGFAHRGRFKTDKMQLSAGPPEGPYVLLGNFVDTKTKWGYYDGLYEVPAGQINTRFYFSSTDPGSLGNLIDAATFEALIKHEDSIVVVVENCGLDTLYMCEGDSISITLNGIKNGVWFGDEGFTQINDSVIKVSPLASSWYGLKVKSDAGDSVFVIVNPKPSVALGNDTMLCIGEEVTLNAGVFDTWSWNVGNEVGQTITVDSTYEYKVVVTNSFNCSDSDSVMITINPLPDVVLRDDTTFCAGGEITIDAGVFDAWNWNVGNETTQTITVDSTYEYKVVVTNIYNCSDSDSVMITVNPLPEVTLGNDTTVCPRAEVRLDANNLGATYLWSTAERTRAIVINEIGVYEVTVTNANGCAATNKTELFNHEEPKVNLQNDTIICSPEILVVNAGVWDTYLWSNGSTNQTITLSETDTVWVDVTDGNACKGRDTIGIQVIALPVVNLVNDTAVCDGESVTLNAQNNGLNFNWNTKETAQEINVNAAGVYGVEVTNQFGCLGSDSMELLIYALPIVNLGNDTVLCEPESVTIDAGDWDAYSWNTGSSLRAITVNSSVTLELNIVDANGCAGSDEISVIVNPLPIINLGNDTTLCINETLNLNAENPGWNYTWNTGENTQQVTKENGFYKVTVYDNYRCFKEDSININLELIPDPYPQKEFEICEGDNINLQPDNGFGMYAINWPNFSSSSNLNVTDAGDYYSAVSGEYCADTFKLTVEVIDTPDVSILNLLGRNTACFEYEIIQLEVLDSNLGRTTYLWSTGETETLIKASVEGGYSVTAINDFCEVTTAIQLKEHCPSTLRIPNAFTPDGNSLNDIFIPVTSGEITNYDFMIFNRWGDLIFRTNNLYEGWDGTYKGEDCQIDVYLYKISYDYLTEFESKKSKQETGRVTLLR
jgi:gliding motility-associated-like protein